MTSILSNKPLAEWGGALTTYRGAFSTTPMQEYSGLPWADIGKHICPKIGPQVTSDKAAVTYFTPGNLRNAPLIGKTLERAVAARQPAVGKQRGAAFMTDSTYLIYDIDGVSIELGKRIFKRLKAAGLSFYAYTSHGFGRPDKPGLRCRVVIPIDRSANSQEYAAVWHGANATLFESVCDKTGAKLCQQQGVWATSPDRKHLARRWGHVGGVASVDALMVLGAAVGKEVNNVATRTSPQVGWDGLAPSLRQIEAALAVLDPNDYAEWDAALSLCVAISKGMGIDAVAVQRLTVEFSNRGSDASKAGNDKPQYDPAHRFDTWTPSVPPSIAAASLFARARDRASRIYRHAGHIGNFKGTKPAWSYLAAHHPKRWSELRAEQEVAA